MSKKKVLNNKFKKNFIKEFGERAYRHLELEINIKEAFSSCVFNQKRRNGDLFLFTSLEGSKLIDEALRNESKD